MRRACHVACALDPEDLLERGLADLELLRGRLARADDALDLEARPAQQARQRASRGGARTRRTPPPPPRRCRAPRPPRPPGRAGPRGAAATLPDRRGGEHRRDQVRAAAVVLLVRVGGVRAVLVAGDRLVLHAVVRGEVAAAEREQRRRQAQSATAASRPAVRGRCARAGRADRLPRERRGAHRAERPARPASAGAPPAARASRAGSRPSPRPASSRRARPARARPPCRRGPACGPRRPSARRRRCARRRPSGWARAPAVRCEAPCRRAGVCPREPGRSYSKVRCSPPDSHTAKAVLPDGPVALLLHGYPESSFMWRDVMPAIADAGWRAVAPDFAGFGDSAARPARHLGAPHRVARALPRASSASSAACSWCTTGAA